MEKASLQILTISKIQQYNSSLQNKEILRKWDLEGKVYIKIVCMTSVDHNFQDIENLIIFYFRKDY